MKGGHLIQRSPWVKSERGKSHARWLWINISHLMPTPALCLQIINCHMCPSGFWHFHNLFIIYHCHRKGHYHGQCHFHYSSQDLACTKLFFLCDFRKSGKRYKDDTLGRDVEARCTRLHNKNTNTKQETLPYFINPSTNRLGSSPVFYLDSI